MLNELSTSLADEFKRKYGIAKPASDCFQEDAELKELMAKIAKLSKKSDPFSEEKFPTVASH